ncbi:GntR family transcriptional regulator [Xylanimonas ulmi]|uniref:GntR family transcriptional regulator n=1 Tax=Xylanimonas ulmi TaxID=228973 RepID=A0A4Q7M1C1_9MICO|nr:GntR family transcriptional regulator [Xylanibacterium ulmi]RZS60362.1 GntR family transcriptional regulator [Xylanibacterium ulmi]
MRIVVSEGSGVPLYEQIVEQVRAAILSRRLAPGEALPSLRRLAHDLRVSLITTTRAYNDLAAAGLIVNVQGKGSFVADVDPALVRERVLSAIESDLERATASARETGVVSLEALHELLTRKWHEHE